jgi:hypothetical protein
LYFKFELFFWGNAPNFLCQEEEVVIIDFFLKFFVTLSAKNREKTVKKKF